MLYRSNPAHTSWRSTFFLLALGLHLAILGFFVTHHTSEISRQTDTPLVVDLLVPSSVPHPTLSPSQSLAANPPRPRPSPVLTSPSKPLLQQDIVPPVPSTNASSDSTAPSANTTATASHSPDTTQRSSASQALTPARFDAAYLRNPAPAYPANARRMGEEGKVLLRVHVTPEGSAESIEIQQSSGSPRLDEAAVKAVRQWRFIPAKRGETPVQSWVNVPLIFALES